MISACSSAPCSSPPPIWLSCIAIGLIHPRQLALYEVFEALYLRGARITILIIKGISLHDRTATPAFVN